MEFLFLIFIGLLTGILSGLLGIGGGIITVPALYYLLESYHGTSPYLMHICVATALASTLFTSSGTSWSHYKKKAISAHSLKILVPGLLAGCILGAFATLILPSSFLRIIFGCMSFVLAIYFFFPNLPQFEIAPHPNKSLSFIGILVGCLSTLLGVGGGIFMVPVLLGYHVPLRNTIATSSVGTLTTAIMGTLIYLWIAKSSTHQIPFTLGFIDLPAMLLIGLCSLATTAWGAHLAHTLPHTLIKRIFALALMGTGFTMIFKP